MKIEAIIVDHEATVCSYLKGCLCAKFPEIKVMGHALNRQEATELMQKVHPSLVFSEVDVLRSDLSNFRTEDRNDCNFIYLSGKLEDAITAIRQDACGFILKPLSATDIVSSVGSALRKLTKPALPMRSTAADGGTLDHTKLIGIPTIDGMDFLYKHEIVRCEGLQKCTRIISTRKANIISSYNIGEFRKLLESSGFFSCHKSHLINLMHVKRFTREGFIFLVDNSAVPLARRKRLEFLEQLVHL